MSTIAAARFDDAAFYLGDANATLRVLRETDPVHWYDEGKFWVITKYDDVKMISAHPERFKSERFAVLMDLIAHRDGREPPNYGTNRGLMFLDPPEHRAQRKTVGVRFTPGAVRELDTRVRTVVRDVLDRLPDGVFDWIECVAEPIPVYVFADLLGIPEADWPQVAGWATTIADIASGASTEGVEVIFGEIGPYLLDLIAQRQAHPTDDLLTMLTTATVDGVPFTEAELITYAVTLLAAGSETTQSLIAGLADCLDQYPEQADKLFADGSLSAGTVEETLRWWTPVMSMARQAADDVELRGKTIRKGDGLLLAYGSANRDEQRWGATAEHYDITRPDAAGHLGFGIGEHFCMGAALARREARALIEELASRAKGLQVVGERVQRVSALVHTHDRLPVQLTH